MPSNGTRLNLDAFVPYRLSVLSNRVSSAIAREYSDRFGLTIAEWRIMAVLGQTAGLSSREVAERTAMDKVQVSRGVASLVESRRVLKQVDSKDGRVARLTLTPRGRAIYLEQVFLAALSREERVLFDRLMAKLDAQAHKLTDASEP